MVPVGDAEAGRGMAMPNDTATAITSANSPILALMLRH
jgi:hypothetical protein